MSAQSLINEEYIRVWDSLRLTIDSNIEKYRKVNGKLGFFFRHKKERYIDENDSQIARLGGDSMFGDLIFSQGIKPVRYLYDTEIEILREYNQASDIFDFIDRLKKLKGKPV